MTGDWRTARWVAALFAMTVALQRFNVPGVSEVSLLLPVVVAWCAWGLMTGILTVDARRFTAWLLASGVTGVALQLQLHFVEEPLVSPSSWALFMLTWSAFTLRIVHNDRRTYIRALDSVVRVCLVLAVACVVMMASQFSGLAYRDWFAEIVPSPLLLQGYVITYPIEYGSPIMKANAWFGLEPSIVSAQLGVGVLAALLMGAPRKVVLLLLTGLVCTVSGSGFAIALVGVVVMVFHPVRRMLLKYVAPVAVLTLVAANTPIGRNIFSRVTEASSDDSSTSLRGLMPYEYLWSQWIEHPLTTLLGRGSGSSQVLVSDSGVLGLLVPTPVKIFFDYGLVAGLVLAVFLLICYAGGPSRAMAVSLLVSMWLLQPGTTQIVLLSLVLLMVTLWSPRRSPVLESVPWGGQPRHRSSTMSTPPRQESLV